ncbi:MAG: glycosyltransferase N-terminal domain-containing protein [Bacteroidota bacterium]|nr:glycosyltransferase N-terminal domain-containing protein [Bacteroidota bacterium]
MNYWQLVYNITAVPLLWAALRIAGIFNKKIRMGIAGRKNLLNNLKLELTQLHSTYRLWFHASSLGEFEQAKPIISAIKKMNPSIDIIATFFSPSGYEHSKNYKLANIISYIPFDSYYNAKKFIDCLQPTTAIMVRYDIWPNIVWQLRKKNIPILIANATMKKDSLRTWLFLKQFHQLLYNNFSYILTVSKNDRQAFLDFNTSSPMIIDIGDTRFDQVVMRSNDAQAKNLLSQSIVQNKKVFIIGQSWGEDEEIILPVLRKIQGQEESLLTIIVPHEPTLEHLERLEDAFYGNNSFIRFSDMNNYNGEKIILIDSVGVLVALYKYAHVVYIGGSFRQGIHNVLEPAVFGVPIIYGPKHTNSQEAVELARLGGGFVIHDEKELYRTLRILLDDTQTRYHAGKIAQSFVQSNCGATDRFLGYLKPYLKQ